MSDFKYLNGATVVGIVWLGCFVALTFEQASADAPPPVVWNRQIGTRGQDYSHGVAVDGTGNVYMGGFTSGSLNGLNAGLLDAFLTKFDAGGTHLWSRQVGTGARDTGFDVAADDAGNAYISGQTSGNLFGPNAGGSDAFAAKFDTSGMLLWSRQLGTANDETSRSIALSAAGDVYICGSTNGSLGGPSAGGFDGFLVKYGESGMLLWSRQFGTMGDDRGEGVAVDAMGNVYVTGRSDGSLGGQNVASYDAYLIKYDAAGTLVWSRQLGTTSLDVGNGVAVDSAGNAFVVGTTLGSFGGPAETSGAFVVKYDRTGTLIWSHQFGMAGLHQSLDVAVDGSGNAYISGSTYGNLGGANAGSTDAFLAKYNAAGVFIWSHQFGTSSWDDGSSVAVDGIGNVYASGRTGGSLFGLSRGNDDAFLIKIAVPEPSVSALVVCGMIGAAVGRRRVLI